MIEYIVIMMLLKNYLYKHYIMNLFKVGAMNIVLLIVNKQIY